MYPQSSAANRNVSSEGGNDKEINYLAKALLKRLCSSKGELRLDENQWKRFCMQIIGPYSSVDMEAFFNCFSDVFSYGPDSTNSEKRIVQVRKTLEICKAHGREDGCNELDCEGLHCCKFFLHGRCKNELNCKFGHNISDYHNQKLLARHFVDGLTPSEIGGLIKSEHPVAKVCIFYNREKGCDYGDKGEGCSAMHVCHHYLLGDCRYKGNCKRSHNIYESQPKNVLKKHGIRVDRSPKQVLEELRAAMKKGDSDDSDEHSDGDIGSSDSDESLGAVGPAPPRYMEPSTSETQLQRYFEPENSNGFVTRYQSRSHTMCVSRSSSLVSAFSRVMKFEYTVYSKREPSE